MNSIKMYILILGVLVSCEKDSSKHRDQDINIILVEVGVDGNLIHDRDDVIFDPYMISFIFSVINNVDSTFLFQSIQEEYLNDNSNNGQFYIGDNVEYELYTRYEGFKIEVNSTATVLAELTKDKFFNDLPSTGYEKYIHDFIMNKSIEFRGKSMSIPVQVPENLVIHFTNKGQGIKYYPYNRK